MPDGSGGVEGGVVILNAEDDPGDTIRPRIEAAGGDLSRVHHVTIEDAIPSIVDASDEFAATLIHHQAKMAIVDPLATFMGSSSRPTETNSTARALLRVKMAAHQAGCSVLLVRHLNKDVGQRKALYRGTNSIAIVGTVRSALMAGIHPENSDQFVLAVGKSNLADRADTGSLAYRIASANGPAGPISKVEWQGATDIRADDIVAPTSFSAEGALETAASWLEERLAEGPQLASELKQLAESEGFAWRTVNRAKKSLQVLSRKRPDGPWEWSRT